MLLKKQENDNTLKAVYASSNICASIYDRASKNLIVIFNNGGQYKYSNVSETDYTRFELADSQGSVLNSHIKKYDFEKLDKVDPSSILSEITELKDAENKAKIDYYLKSMVEKMKGVISYYQTTESIDPALYTKMKSSMDDYEKIIASVASNVIND